MSHAPSASRPVARIATDDRWNESFIICTIPECGLVVEIETEREVRWRRRLDEVGLDVTRALVALRIDAGVLAPPRDVAHAELEARVARANLRGVARRHVQHGRDF